MPRFTHASTSSPSGVATDTRLETMLERAHRAAHEGDHSLAMSLFRTVARAANDNYAQEAATGAAGSLLALGRFEQAEQLYERALTVGDDPDLTAEAMQNLAITRYVRGDRFGACELMQDLAVLDHPVYSPLARDNLNVLFGLVVI